MDWASTPRAILQVGFSNLDIALDALTDGTKFLLEYGWMLRVDNALKFLDAHLSLWTQKKATVTCEAPTPKSFALLTRAFAWAVASNEWKCVRLVVLVWTKPRALRIVRPRFFVDVDSPLLSFLPTWNAPAEATNRANAEMWDAVLRKAAALLESSQVLK